MRIGKQDLSGHAVVTSNLANLIFIAPGEKAVVSLGPQQAVVASITTSGANNGKTLVIADSSWYQTAAGTNNQIPGGSNVTAANYQSVGPWNDWGSSDGKNTITKFYLGNTTIGSGSYSQRISASANDGYKGTSVVSWDYTNAHLFVGAGSSYTYIDGFRFTGVSVPQGATISAATLSITPQNTVTGTFKEKVVGIAEDNTADFSSDPTGRSTTSASVAWTITNTTSGTTLTSPDISSVIQEIINRSGWASGNALGLFIKDNGTGVNVNFDIYTADGTPANAASISITYTGGGTTQTVILDTQMRVVSSDENITAV